jgi:predicted membrane protein
MNPSLIWGTILILFGLSFILKSVFQITVPLVRPFFGGVLIYLGLSIMMDPFNESPDKKSVIFGRTTIIGSPIIKTYNVTFGSGVIDLSQLTLEEPTQITINTVMGSSIVILPDVSAKVRVNAIFARAGLPDETLVSFGRNVYKTDDEAEQKLFVQVNVILGNVDIKLVPKAPVRDVFQQPIIENKQQEA